MKVHYAQIGAIGASSMIVLLVLVLVRWYSFWKESVATRDTHPSTLRKIYKKHAFFSLLAIAAICDIPMYISFIAIDNYAIITYSFHKFTAWALCASYSITISNWSVVLFEIQEDSITPFVLRRAFLISVNSLFFLISVLNFVFCYISADMKSFLSTNIYYVGVFAIIIAPLVLTVTMLHAGLRLSMRIQGAAGTSQRRELDTTFGQRSRSSKSIEFQAAVRRLNIVMIACAIVIMMQVLLMILNLALGYANEKDKTVGPDYFYYIFIDMVPAWVLTLSQLHLSQKSVMRHSDLRFGGLSTMDALESEDDSQSTLNSRLIASAMGDGSGSVVGVNSWTGAGLDGDADKATRSPLLVFTSRGGGAGAGGGGGDGGGVGNNSSVSGLSGAYVDRDQRAQIVAEFDVYSSHSAGTPRLFSIPSGDIMSEDLEAMSNETFSET